MLCWPLTGEMYSTAFYTHSIELHFAATFNACNLPTYSSLCWLLSDLLKTTLLVLQNSMHSIDHQRATLASDLASFLPDLEQARRPDDIVIWRSAVPGHCDCWKYAGPVDTYHVLPCADQKIAGHGWHNVPGLNEVAKRAVGAYKFIFFLGNEYSRTYHELYYTKFLCLKF